MQIGNPQLNARSHACSNHSVLLLIVVVMTQIVATTATVYDGEANQVITSQTIPGATTFRNPVGSLRLQDTTFTAGVTIEMDSVWYANTANTQVLTITIDNCRFQGSFLTQRLRPVAPSRMDILGCTFDSTAALTQLSLGSNVAITITDGVLSASSLSMTSLELTGALISVTNLASIGMELTSSTLESSSVVNVWRSAITSTVSLASSIFRSSSAFHLVDTTVDVTAPAATQALNLQSVTLDGDSAIRASGVGRLAVRGTGTLKAIDGTSMTQTHGRVVIEPGVQVVAMDGSTLREAVYLPAVPAPSIAAVPYCNIQGSVKIHGIASRSEPIVFSNIEVGTLEVKCEMGAQVSMYFEKVVVNTLLTIENCDFSAGDGLVFSDVNVVGFLSLAFLTLGNTNNLKRYLLNVPILNCPTGCDVSLPFVDNMAVPAVVPWSNAWDSCPNTSTVSLVPTGTASPSASISRLATPSSTASLTAPGTQTHQNTESQSLSPSRSALTSSISGASLTPTASPSASNTLPATLTQAKTLTRSIRAAYVTSLNLGGVFSGPSPKVGLSSKTVGDVEVAIIGANESLVPVVSGDCSTSAATLSVIKNASDVSNNSTDPLVRLYSATVAVDIAQFFQPDDVTCTVSVCADTCRSATFSMAIVVPTLNVRAENVTEGNERFIRLYVDIDGSTAPLLNPWMDASLSGLSSLPFEMYARTMTANAMSRQQNLIERLNGTSDCLRYSPKELLCQWPSLPTKYDSSVVANSGSGITATIDLIVRAPDSYRDRVDIHVHVSAENMRNMRRATVVYLPYPHIVEDVNQTDFNSTDGDNLSKPPLVLTAAPGDNVTVTPAPAAPAEKGKEPSISATMINEGGLHFVVIAAVAFLVLLAIQHGVIRLRLQRRELAAYVDMTRTAGWEFVMFHHLWCSAAYPCHRHCAPIHAFNLYVGVLLMYVTVAEVSGAVPGWEGAGRHVILGMVGAASLAVPRAVLGPLFGHYSITATIEDDEAKERESISRRIASHVRRNVKRAAEYYQTLDSNATKPAQGGSRGTVIKGCAYDNTNEAVRIGALVLVVVGAKKSTLGRSRRRVVPDALLGVGPSEDEPEVQDNNSPASVSPAGSSSPAFMTPEDQSPAGSPRHSQLHKALAASKFLDVSQVLEDGTVAVSQGAASAVDGSPSNPLSPDTSPPCFKGNRWPRQGDFVAPTSDSPPDDRPPLPTTEGGEGAEGPTWPTGDTLASVEEPVLSPKPEPLDGGTTLELGEESIEGISLALPITIVEQQKNDERGDSDDSVKAPETRSAFVASPGEAKLTEKSPKESSGTVVASPVGLSAIALTNAADGGLLPRSSFSAAALPARPALRRIPSESSMSGRSAASETSNDTTSTARRVRFSEDSLNASISSRDGPVMKQDIFVYLHEQARVARCQRQQNIGMGIAAVIAVILSVVAMNSTRGIVSDSDSFHDYHVSCAIAMALSLFVFEPIVIMATVLYRWLREDFVFAGEETCAETITCLLRVWHPYEGELRFR